MAIVGKEASKILESPASVVDMMVNGNGLDQGQCFSCDVGGVLCVVPGYGVENRWGSHSQSNQTASWVSVE